MSEASAPGLDATHAEMLGDCLQVGIAEENVGIYFDKAWFTGRHFDSLNGSGEAEGTRDRITASDIVAVSMLGVNVPAAAAVSLMEDESGEVRRLLTGVPTGTPIWQVDEEQLLHERAPAWRLWYEVRDRHGMGPTTTSKLLARKRPHLFPVWDQFVGEVLGSTVGHWALVQSLMRDESRRARIQEIAMASAPAHVSLLRVLDVAIWMHRTGRGQWDGRAR